MTTPTHWWTMTAQKDLSWYGQDSIYGGGAHIATTTLRPLDIKN